MNKDIDRILSWKPCKEELRWFEKQSSLEEVWDKCEEPSWLFFICQAEDELNLKKEQSVAIAIAVASRVLDKYEVAYPDDKRPRKAIEAAQAWLDNPTKENADAASAAYAASTDAYASAAHAVSAAYSARAAAYAALADAAGAAGAAFAAARAAAHPATSYATANAASASASASAERKAQADIIRLLVPNPFK